MATALFELDLLGGAVTRAAEKVTGRLADAAPFDTIRPEDYADDLRLRGRIGWTENAFNEYCTAAAMGQLVNALAAAGAPHDLLCIASGFALEEMVHVELCARVAMRLGGGVPITYDPEALAVPLDPGLTPLQRANELVVRICCVGEVFSLPMLAGSMRAATHPAMRAVLERIVRGEAMHGQLGWMYLDWVGPTLDADERHRLAGCAGDAIAHVRPLFERLRSGDGLDPVEAGSMGWMAPRDYVALAEPTLDEEVAGRLRSYGIDVPRPG